MAAENNVVLLDFSEPLIVMRMVGVPDTAEMLRSLAEIERVTIGWKFNITLVDLSRQTEAPSLETRRAIAEAPKGEQVSRGTAIFGASFAMRTIGALLVNVMNMKQKNASVTKFFTTEAEARAWLQQRADMPE